MPLLVSSERSCCLWLVQSKYFYPSVVLENDVYSSPGYKSQPRLNTGFLIVFFSLQWVARVGFPLFVQTLHHFFIFSSCCWCATDCEIGLGCNQHPSESLLHEAGGAASWQKAAPTRSDTSRAISGFSPVRIHSPVQDIKRFLHIISSSFRLKFYLPAVAGAHLIKCAPF